MKKISKIGLLGVILITIVASSLEARKGRNRRQSYSEPQEDYSTTYNVSNGNLVDRYLSQKLKVEDLAKFNYTLRFEKVKEHFNQYFSDKIAPVFKELLAAFSRSRYPHAIMLAPAGSGKSFLIDPVTAVFSYGLVPDNVTQHIGKKNPKFEVLQKEFIGKMNVVLINTELLALNPAGEDEPFSREETRMQLILSGLFDAARKEFHRKNGQGERIGRRTLFILDEVATFPPLVQDALKKQLDNTGFQNPNDAFRSQLDAGFSVLAMTTLDEYKKMVRGDSAVQRRYKTITLQEFTEGEALSLLIDEAHRLQQTYRMEVDVEALSFIIRMRHLLDFPPVAMPASVLTALDDLFLSFLDSEEPKERITLKDAQEFVIKRAGLTDVWLEGPNGEPPFHNLAERVKKKAIGQDAVVDAIADIYKAWARLGFGVEAPVVIVGGPSESGKNTVTKAFSEELFSHTSKDLHFSIGGIGGFGIEALIEGPPLGNHSDQELPLILKRMEGGQSSGILVFDEGRDAPSVELTKLKVFIEDQEIRPRGRDARPRPLRYPIMILGQWGEEFFQGKTEAQARKAYERLSQNEIDQFFLKPSGSGNTGAISYALLQRAKKTGGVFLLAPVPKNDYAKIVEIQFAKIKENLRVGNNIEIEAGENFYEFVAKYAVKSKNGPRALESLVKDFSVTAISKAMDQGLPSRDLKLKVSATAGRVTLVNLESGKQYTWAPQELSRAKSPCVAVLENLEESLASVSIGQ